MVTAVVEQLCNDSRLSGPPGRRAKDYKLSERIRADVSHKLDFDSVVRSTLSLSNTNSDLHSPPSARPGRQGENVGEGKRRTWPETDSPS